MEKYFDVDVFPYPALLRADDPPPHPYQGKGAAHPLYRRDKQNRFPIAYDVAVFKVGIVLDISNVVVKLCREIEIQGHQTTALAFEVNKSPTEKTPEEIRKGAVLEYKVHDVSNNVITWFEGGTYYIDPSKQFTSHLENPHKNKDVYTAGGPVFSKNPTYPRGRCIVGIMSFSDGPIITSTKVDSDLIDWVENAMHAKSLSFFDEGKPTDEGTSKFQRQFWITEDKNLRLVDGRSKFKSPGSQYPKKSG